MNLITTADGTVTLYSEIAGQTYHNRFGALTESQALYIQPSHFEERLAGQQTLRFLDPFFGLGYLSAACIHEFMRVVEKNNWNDKTLELTAIEYDGNLMGAFSSVIEQFETPFLKSFKEAFAHKIYYQTQTPTLENTLKPAVEMTLGPVSFKLFIADLRHALPQLSPAPFDGIFHDPFSPDKQPELWTVELFAHYKRILEPHNGQIHTYSQNAGIRNALRENGFMLYKASKADYQKRGTLARLLPSSHFDPLTPKEIALITEARSGEPYRDAPDLTWPREQIQTKRQEAYLSSTKETSSRIHKKFILK